MGTGAETLGVFGATGRLGRVLCQAAQARGTRVTLRVSRGVRQDDAAPSVVVDVSHRSALPSVLSYCAERSVPLVECVSGLEEGDLRGLDELALRVPVVHAPNLAFGHHLQLAMLEALEPLLRSAPEGWEVTVSERHPTHKVDAPSATALALSERWRRLSGGRPARISSVRGGLPVSEHELCLTLPGEALHVRHEVGDRMAAAQGALRAADWVRARRPGRWTMSHVYRDLEELAC